MKKLIAFFWLFIAYNGVAVENSDTGRSMDLEYLSAIKQSLSYVTPSNAVITTWLKVIKEPYLKIQAARILRPYLKDFSRKDYFHISLLSMNTDAARLTFLRAHQYRNISAKEVAEILFNINSKHEKIEGLRVIMARMDESSKIIVANSYEPIINVFTTSIMREKVKEIMTQNQF
jgi:hypothetical protein